MSISERQTRRDSPLVRVPKEHRKDWREFMQAQMNLPDADTRWRGMCESLQRQAHEFPARFASAYAHMIATPLSERMDPMDAPRTAFIFVDDPKDSNAFGHIVGKWDMADTVAEIPVVTNDVNDSETGYDGGNVTVVPLGWFPRYWGDQIQFATMWFGGDEIPQVKEPTGPEDTERWIKESIEAAQAVIEVMRKAARDNDEAKHPRHEKAIRREIEDQRQIIRDLRKLLP